MAMLTLGKLPAFCGQFVDGQVSVMVVQEDGVWKVDPEQRFGCDSGFVQYAVNIFIDRHVSKRP